MKVNLDTMQRKLNTPQDQEKPNLSRRTFLAWLTILGVGYAAAMTLSVREADATTETDTTSKPKGLADDKPLAEGKKAELVGGVDPDDALGVLCSNARDGPSRGAPDGPPDAPDSPPGAPPGVIVRLPTAELEVLLWRRVFELGAQLASINPAQHAKRG